MNLGSRDTAQAALRRAARAGVIIGIPLALVLGAAGVTRAFDATSGWTAGETLTAADLNTLVGRLGSLAAGLNAHSATIDALVSEVTTLKTRTASLEAGAADVSALASRVAALEASAAEVSALRSRVAALEDDVAAAPFGREFSASISDQGTDLGLQLGALVARHRNVVVTLARGTTDSPAEYRWNTPVWLPVGRRLVVSGDGFENGAQNIGVKIWMDQALARPEDVQRRIPARLVALERSSFLLQGVHVVQSGISSLPITLSPVFSGVFTLGEQASIDLSQTRIEVTENLVNTHSRAWGRVRFGHTFIERSSTAVVPVSTYRGNQWTGGGAVVSAPKPYTHLNPPGWSPGPGITVLED